MITKIVTHKSSLITAASTPLFKMIAIMLIIQNFKRISISKVQVYLWGIQSSDNKQTFIKLSNSKAITRVPFLIEDDLMALLIQCKLNNLVEFETNTSGKTYLKLGCMSDRFLSSIKDNDLVQELTQSLNEMKKLTENAINDIKFDF